MRLHPVAVPLVALLLAACAHGVRPPSDPADPGGVWTLAGQVDGDGKDSAQDPLFVTTWTVDGSARTIVTRWTMVNVQPPQPDTVQNLAYTITPEGYWHIDVAGPRGGMIEYSAACSPTTLTLTRVRYEGLETDAPPPAASREGEAPSPATKKIPPPRILRFAR